MLAFLRHHLDIEWASYSTSLLSTYWWYVFKVVFLLYNTDHKLYIWHFLYPVDHCSKRFKFTFRRLVFVLIILIFCQCLSTSFSASPHHGIIPMTPQLSLIQSPSKLLKSSISSGHSKLANPSALPPPDLSNNYPTSICNRVLDTPPCIPSGTE